MLKNRLTAVVLAIIALLLTSCELLYGPEQPTGQQTGILWQIERAGLRPSYLLGTIHSDDSRVIDIPAIIRQKLRQADSFSAELKMDPLSMQEGSRLMFLPPGQTLVSLIGKQRYQRCVTLLAGYGVPDQVLQRMKPWALVVTLSMPKSRSGIVLDQWLYQQAEQQGKKTYGLETTREQTAIFESFSLQQQLVMLDDAIKEFNRLPMLFDDLLHYYLQRDLTGLQHSSEKYMLQGDGMVARQFKQKALLDRNHLMVRRMQPRLLEGNSFIAVGALHLPGEEGILRLLQRQGYRVTPVY